MTALAHTQPVTVMSPTIPPFEHMYECRRDWIDAWMTT